MSDPARPEPSPRVGAWEALAFGCELALLAALAVAGWLGADGTLPRLALAVVLPVLVVAMWAVWMAPRSPRRLARGQRIAVQVLLFVLAGAALAAVGHRWWGLALVAISGLDVVGLASRERALPVAGGRAR